MIWTLAAKTTGVIMDEGEPSQLYRTLLLEQRQNPSQAVEILIAYYQMSEEEAWLVSKHYHAKKAIRGVNGHTRKQLNKSHRGNRKSTEDHKRPYMLASLRRGNSRTS
tara:strand:- start:86 stop:409 length:324 start_codon:yes stop_codon:yes gene_type:complete